MLRPLLLVILASACRPDPAAEAAPPTPSVSAAGHYCDLSVFTKEEHARHRDLVAKFKAVVRSTHELANGYAFEFPGTFKEAGEWLDGTRRCCPTIQLAMDFSPHTGTATLRATL